MSADPNRRSTSNSNDRGSSHGRRSRRRWLVEQFRANVDVLVIHAPDEEIVIHPLHPGGLKSWIYRLSLPAEYLNDPYAGLPYELVPACRCYRCGRLLTEDEVSPDRWPVLGVNGGRYVQGNIRPACEKCNTETGSAVGHARKAAKRAAKAARAVRVALPPGAAWRSYSGVRYRHVVLADRTAQCGLSFTSYWAVDRKKTRCPSCVEALA